MRPASTSTTGSAVRDTRMVSPMPSRSSEPMPAADFISPSRSVPASVTPNEAGNRRRRAVRGWPRPWCARRRLSPTKQCRRNPIFEERRVVKGTLGEGGSGGPTVLSIYRAPASRCLRLCARECPRRGRRRPLATCRCPRYCRGLCVFCRRRQSRLQRPAYNRNGCPRLSKGLSAP